jgi:uncharacterized protein (DUF2147 family)
MSRHRWLPAFALALLLPTTAPATPPAPDITGQYRAARSGMVVSIAMCSGDRLCARIVALGTLPALDANNPTPALRNRPLCGATVIEALEWQDGSWHGTLYEPQNGTGYSITVAPAENRGVRLTGYSGRPVLMRTYLRPVEVWERVAPPATPCAPAVATS